METVLVAEEVLDEVRRRMLHKGPNGVLAVLYNVIKQIMLDLFQKDVIEKTLDGHIAKYFDTSAAA